MFHNSAVTAVEVTTNSILVHPKGKKLNVATAMEIMQLVLRVVQHTKKRFSK